MNAISSVITVLSKEDKKKFLLLLRQKNKRDDVKNIELFRLLDAGSAQKNLDVVLYGKSSKGAYHALCKRLFDSLIDFVATKSFEEESTEEMSTLKLLMAGRIIFERGQIPLGFKILNKAEDKARKYGLYTILREVLFTKIQYAHLNPAIDLNVLIQKYQSIKLNIEQEENLNLFYATIQHELNNSPLQVADVISRNMELYAISISNNLSYQALFKILEICNEVASVTRNYYGVLEFVETAYQQIETSDRIENKHLFFHIKILYYMANSFFRIKKFEQSANYLASMHHYMSLQHKKYYTAFYPQYALIENFLLIYTGKAEKAIDNLNVIEFKKYKGSLEYVLNLKLALVVALFLQERYMEAFRVYKDFYHSDIWYTVKAGIIWVIKKNLIELLLLIELHYMDLADSRLKSFQKKHSVHLKKHEAYKVLEFVRLVKVYHLNKEIAESSRFKAQVDLLIHTENKEEDIFVISFYAWLKSKTVQASLYNTCLAYVHAV